MAGSRHPMRDLLRTNLKFCATLDVLAHRQNYVFLWKVPSAHAELSCTSSTRMFLLWYAYARDFKTGEVEM